MAKLYVVLNLSLQAIVLLALARTTRAAFEVKNVQGAVCMRVDTNFSVSATASKNGNVVKQTILDLDQFQMNHGSCETARAVLLLNSTTGENTVFRFMFNTSAETSDVEIVFSFSFYPRDLFPELPDLSAYTYRGFLSRLLSAGKSQRSFKCADKKVRLAPDPAFRNASSEKDPYTFSVMLNVIRFQGQAFNMKNGTFSSPLNCYVRPPGPSAGLIALIVIFVVLPIAIVTAAVVLVLRRNRAGSDRSGVL